MNTSTDLAARQVFLEELQRRVALRSAMHRDDIEEVHILEAVDADGAATRELLRVSVPPLQPVHPAPDSTGEIEASDVLEVAEIVSRSRMPRTEVPCTVMPRPAMPPPLMPPPFAAYLPVVPLDESRHEDAFDVTSEPPSTGPVTFPLVVGSGEEGPVDDVDGAGAIFAPRQRRLGWIVATVLACAVTLAASALVTEYTGNAAREARALPTSAVRTRHTTGSASPPRGGAALPAPDDPSPPVVSMDVKNLPPAIMGTVVAPSRRAVFVDEQRVQGSTTVSCGKHAVRTGTSKKTRTIDVPCGGTVAVR